MGFNMFLTGSTNITSPNYPKNYTENSNTFWTFAAPIGEQLQFKVTEMLIEPCCDYLKVQQKYFHILIFAGFTDQSTLPHFIFNCS